MADEPQEGQVSEEDKPVIDGSDTGTGTVADEGQGEQKPAEDQSSV